MLRGCLGLLMLTAFVGSPRHISAQRVPDFITTFLTSRGRGRLISTERTHRRFCRFLMFCNKICMVSFVLFPQQRKLMGSSAQISSGVCRCGSQEQVPEEGSGRFRKVPEGSGRFRRVPACAGVGSGGGFRKVRPKVGSGRSRKVPEGWRVPARVGLGSGGRVRKVRESSGVVCCLAT